MVEQTALLDWTGSPLIHASADEGSVRVVRTKGLSPHYDSSVDERSDKPSRLMSDEDLLEMFEIQPPISGAITKKGRIFFGADWSFTSNNGTLDEAEKERLSTLFDWPSGDESFSVILCRTLMRLDILGNCFWHWLMPSITTVQRVARETITSVARELTARGVDHATISRVVEKSAIQAAKAAQFPVGFYILEGTVTPQVDSKGNFKDETKAYLQTVGQEKVYLPFEQVTHLRVPDPRRRVYGLPRLACLALINQMDQQGQVMNDSLLRRKGRLGGALKVRDASRASRDRLEAEFREKHLGGTTDDPRAYEKAGGLIVVEVTGEKGDVEYVPFEISPRDMQMSELHEWARMNYGMVTGVHGGMLGVTRDVNRSNMEMSAYDLTENELGPTAKLICDRVNKDLRDYFGIVNTRLQLKLRDLRSEQERARTSKMWQEVGAESLNERLVALGKSPVVGGDTYLLSLGPGIFAFHPEREPVLITLQQGITPLGEVLCTEAELSGAERVEALAFPGAGTTATAGEAVAEEGKVLPVQTFEALSSAPPASSPAALVTQLFELSEQLRQERATRGL